MAGPGTNYRAVVGLPATTTGIQPAANPVKRTIRWPAVLPRQVRAPCVLLGLKKVSEETFDASHVLIAFGQGTDADEDLAEVGEGRAAGQFVEGLVGKFPSAGCEVGQHRCDGRFIQPAPGGDGVLGGGDVAPEGFEPGMQSMGGRTQQFVEAPVDQASDALAGMRIVRVGAGGTLDLIASS
ncbi:hypothetical protein AB0P36_32155 [Streptomyces flavidovirens]|uniref:hypothetical protein n=1 Tax=Streptomyces flavidovirens TaxID=67298 RepID=UPI00342E170E